MRVFQIWLDSNRWREVINCRQTHKVKCLELHVRFKHKYGPKLTKNFVSMKNINKIHKIPIKSFNNKISQNFKCTQKFNDTRHLTLTLTLMP